ncbi:type IV pilus modification PilV family protein [Deinococcus ruber]|uniref:Uncharacterized protein n=1 Tax=Deinococcus ruber TaxID=1848197 RepID=A0A918FHS7_9DEIO|nr:hypothetical protein [Deinococcus ruber]GGR38554.1 hypothetical protein GCM10008957_54560 [Deinococcus ruber]
MQHTRTRTAGITLIEALLSAVVIVLALVAFATVNLQSARTVSSSQLSTYAADALTAVTASIQQGGLQYARPLDLSAEDLQVLASSGSKRAALRPALSGQISPLGGDPPTYRVQIRSSDFTLAAIATAPGGTP